MSARSRIPLSHAFSATIALAAFLCAAPLSAQPFGLEPIAFKVFRGGEPLGHHRVDFRRMGEDLHVEIDILLEVEIAFLTVFRYRHRNHEVWRDGRLVSIDTETNDDGERFWLRGRATEAGLRIEGSSGRFLAPADIIPTSYWNPLTVATSRFLDTQHGRLIRLEVAPAGVEAVTLAGRAIEARRYQVKGDLSLELWYTPQGEWAKTRFEARGEQVVYRRSDESGRLAAIEAFAGGR